MKNFFKRALSVLLSICITLSCSVVGFAAGAVVGSVLKSIGAYLVGRLEDYIWNEATGTQAQAQYAADKIAVLSVIRDWCVENNYNPDCAEFQQFILDMYLEAPDNDDMTSKYGSDWGNLHSQVHPYFAKLSSLYQCGWEEAYNWIVEHYDDDITKLKPDGTVQIPSGDLVEFIEEQNTTNTPKGKDLFEQSYRTDTFIRSNYDDGDVYASYVTLWNNAEKNESFEDLYLYPFYYVSSNQLMCYTDFQYHFYYKTGYDSNSDLGLFVDVYYYTEGIGWVLQDCSGVKLELFEQSNKPFTISVSPPIHKISYTWFSTFNSVADYSTCKRSNTQTKYLVGAPSIAFDYKSVYSSDVYKPSSGVFNRKYSGNSDQISNFGFICSHSLIERTYDIDTSKIPSNQVINITGDTIYDYSITNPDTGASTTINEYVTNNYYYPEVPSTSEPSGGGVGGNVNVGGNISVGGQVDVNIGVSVPDININVNQGSGAGGSGTGINPDDILDGSSVDFDKYYDDAVSQASGVRAFLGQFFDFLPAELVGLICMLVAVAIVCRIFGR